MKIIYFKLFIFLIVTLSCKKINDTLQNTVSGEVIVDGYVPEPGVIFRIDKEGNEIPIVGSESILLELSNDE